MTTAGPAGCPLCALTTAAGSASWSRSESIRGASAATILVRSVGRLRAPSRANMMWPCTISSSSHRATCRARQVARSAGTHAEHNTWRTKSRLGRLSIESSQSHAGQFGANPQVACAYNGNRADARSRDCDGARVAGRHDQHARDLAFRQLLFCQRDWRRDRLPPLHIAPVIQMRSASPAGADHDGLDRG